MRRAQAGRRGLLEADPMRNDPFSPLARPATARPVRQHPLVGALLAAGYAVFYWFSDRTVDRCTGEKVMIDEQPGCAADRFGAAGLPAVLWRNGRWVPNAPIARDVRDIASGSLPRSMWWRPRWPRSTRRAAGRFAGFPVGSDVDPVRQANAFCLPGGKMAVYTGLVPVARTRDAMAVVMGHQIAHALLRHSGARRWPTED